MSTDIKCPYHHRHLYKRKSRNSGIQQRNQSINHSQNIPSPPMTSPTSATIHRLTQLTPSVRLVDIAIPSISFTFHPGQWILPLPQGYTHPTPLHGFSICSTPQHFRETRHIQIAVKQSPHPIASWIHSDTCTEGSAITLGVGGKFRWRGTLPSVFMAGGIGITPLYSMLGHILSLYSTSPPSPSLTDTNTTPLSLIYLAQSIEDMVFLPQLEEISSSSPNIFSLTTLTESPTPEYLSTLIPVPDKKPDNYLCGPPPLVHLWKSQLGGLGHCSSRILHDH